MAENIKKFYMYRKLNSMYLKSLINLLMLKGDVNFFFDERTCLNGILALCQICPYWIKMIKHESGTIIKINKKDSSLNKISADIRSILLLSK